MGVKRSVCFGRGSTASWTAYLVKSRLLDTGLCVSTVSLCAFGGLPRGYWVKERSQANNTQRKERNGGGIIERAGEDWQEAEYRQKVRSLEFCVHTSPPGNLLGGRPWESAPISTIPRLFTVARPVTLTRSELVDTVSQLVKLKPHGGRYPQAAQGDNGCPPISQPCLCGTTTKTDRRFRNNDKWTHIWKLDFGPENPRRPFSGRTVMDT
ncbi:hypothetical protein WMY93_002179 [Mugilogobius chulae]|uniref:Uncharacterized protein n=1 Tax=Mugilogobius chulae TaxID=88201 RepID=A0AAW0PST7_9GOBI